MPTAFPMEHREKIERCQDRQTGHAGCQLYELAVGSLKFRRLNEFGHKNENIVSRESRIYKKHIAVQF